MKSGEETKERSGRLVERRKREKSEERKMIGMEAIDEKGGVRQPREATGKEEWSREWLPPSINANRR